MVWVLALTIDNYGGYLKLFPPRPLEGGEGMERGYWREAISWIFIVNP